MRVTGDQALVKKLNKSIVLDTIRRNGPLSRTDVSERTGLNKATVSNLTLELLEQKLVEETGLGASSGGRKPLMLLFNGAAGCAIGIELGVTLVKAALTDLKGGILLERSAPLGRHDPDTAFAVILEAVRPLLEEAPDTPHGVVGIGIGVPGMVDESGTILYAPNLGWEGVDLGARLEKEFGVPVVVDNEANAGAAGEREYGAGRHVRHLVYVSAGMGIGSGMIIDGQLYKGAWGYAGETGHMSIESDGRLCSCGSRGCWELYASERAYAYAPAAGGSAEGSGDADVRARDAASPSSLPALTTPELAEYARQGDAATLEMYREIGRRLGIGVTNLVNGFNPEKIVVGGPLTEAKEWIEPAMLATIAERALPYHRRELAVSFSELGSRSALLGAAHLAVSQFLGRVRVSL
ncbi:ROK family transcriptional regulator [Saccharibacillus alkalitolerans]|uniref:ROK family transcriptional regulator n=1 Tax=Saccharibacillus alkalitolerans TaxID=2705290 RepID=A0ABX0FCU4_9BACL|nr:ROK family transcriptional regulator [Saccharibacillus alkalitolerans]NGZ77859.1 ROK family transcriptional regulator [Saccharibacillus alkalitolerans]